ncbi:glycosyltransferase family 4 protein [Candidatus Uhrbacteria bacterium]|nr:glycosyltransferase family 4 protein [Candidatus Uhrbacteria bacterium]
MNPAKRKIVLGITLAEPGGAQSFVFGFARWLHEHGHEVHVMAGEGQWLFTRCQEMEIPIHPIPALKRNIDPIKDWKAYKQIKAKLAELKPDAIHLNSAKMGVLGGRAARALNIPRIVYRNGGWAFLEPLIFPAPLMFRLAEAWTSRDKDVIICVHEGDEEAARKAGIRPRETLMTIPNGIDIPTFDRALQTRDYARRALNIDGVAFVFGTIAHFYPAKDLPRYMDACALVHAKRPDVRFILIGNGREQYRVRRKRKEHELEQVVSLIGNYDNAATILRGFDAFVLPSAKEGMPRALLEAMAAGLPCIATNVGANTSLLKDQAGWIVPKQSPEELAEQMLYVLDHPEEAKQRGHNARKIIEEKYPLEKNYRTNEAALLGSGF